MPPSAFLPSRFQALAGVVAIWALIYLPGLGSLEIKGEEGRRLLPAQAMLETGRWVVPSIGGVDYLAKPPLINWLAAGAFAVAGDTQSEWAARAPSALAVLALGLCTVGALARWLGPGGAGLAAIFLLTNIGMMEKGRLAEIEALYLSLTGIAIVLWLGAWRRDVAERGGRPSWRAWTLPWVFLGLGLLTKGPLHLVFFYAVMAATLVCTGRRRDWLNGPHLAGIALMLAIFAAWAVPYLRQTAAGGAGGVWLAQFQGRMEVNEKFRLGVWLLNVPRGLVNYLPWTVLLPLAWRRVPEQTLDAAIARGLRWAVGGCFLAVSLAPGGQPRYTLPLLTPASVLLALTLAREERLPAWLPAVWARINGACLSVAMLGVPLAIFYGGRELWPRAALLALLAAVSVLVRVRRQEPWMLAAKSAAAMALITALYAVGAVPVLRRAESVRPPAAAINRATAGERIAVLRPGFVPFLFYLRPAPVYVQTPEAVPPSVHYLLVPEEKASSGEPLILRVNDKRTHAEWVLLRLETPPDKGL